MLGGVIDMTEVNYWCCAAIKHLHAPSQLAPEDILRCMQTRGKIAFGHVLQQCLVGVAALQECLPYMVVRVHKPR